jgi:hypothetical protein
MKNFLLLGFLLLSLVLFSQDTLTTTEVPIYTSSPLKEAVTTPLLDGTYQIILANIDVNPNITEAIIQQIKNERTKNIITYIVINDDAKIKILPHSTIQAKGFVPLKKFSYEN